MRFYVTYKINARYEALVEANTVEEAREKAKEEYWDANFGECHDIDGDQISVEDENGNILWEK